jgi:hypothetical protein
MSSAKAILLGAILIAASILFVNTVNPAAAQYVPGAQYQLMHHSNTVANSSVFRMNVNTGELSYCYVPGAGDAQVVCTKPIK